MAATRLKRRQFSDIGEEFYFNQLDNGITVFLLPKKDFKETFAMISSQFGSIDTEFTVDGKTKKYPAGIAHFLEHQLFEMENNKDASYEFTKLGADSNAYTDFEKTVYYFSAVDSIKENLALLQDFTSKAIFTDASIENEKAIIAQEIDMYQDDADDFLYQGILTKLYPKTPLAEDIVGSQTSIRHLNKRDLEENFHYFYHPSNLILLVVGSFDVKQVYKDIVTVQKELSQVKAPQIERSDLKLLPVTSASSLQKDVTLPKLAVGFRFDFIGKMTKSLLREKLLLKLFFSLLFGWTSQRYQKWYEEGKIDDSFDIKIEVSASYQFVVIMLDTKEPIAMSNQLRQAVKKFETDENLSESHLQTLKNELYGDFISSLDSMDTLANQFIDNLWRKETYFDFPSVLQSLEIRDVVEFGQKIMREMQVTDFTLFPK